MGEEAVFTNDSALQKTYERFFYYGLENEENFLKTLIYLINEDLIPEQNKIVKIIEEINKILDEQIQLLKEGQKIDYDKIIQVKKYFNEIEDSETKKMILDKLTELTNSNQTNNTQKDTDKEKDKKPKKPEKKIEEFKRFLSNFPEKKLEEEFTAICEQYSKFILLSAEGEKVANDKLLELKKQFTLKNGKIRFKEISKDKDNDNNKDNNNNNDNINLIDIIAINKEWVTYVYKMLKILRQMSNLKDTRIQIEYQSKLLEAIVAREGYLGQSRTDFQIQNFDTYFKDKGTMPEDEFMKEIIYSVVEDMNVALSKKSEDIKKLGISEEGMYQYIVDEVKRNINEYCRFLNIENYKDFNLKETLKGIEEGKQDISIFELTRFLLFRKFFSNEHNYENINTDQRKKISSYIEKRIKECIREEGLEFDSNKKQNYEHEGILYKTICQLRYLDTIIKSNNLNFLKLWEYVRSVMIQNNKMYKKDSQKVEAINTTGSCRE